MKNILFVMLSLYLVSNVYAEETKYLVLSSGDKNTITEAWYVSHAEIEALPFYDPLSDPLPLDIQQVITSAYNHIKKRFPGSTYVLNEIRLERFAENINPYPERKAKDWVFLVSFKYSDYGAVQMIPVFLNGLVVLSDNEK
jgi:hypothetical protein